MRNHTLECHWHIQWIGIRTTIILQMNINLHKPTGNICNKVQISWSYSRTCEYIIGALCTFLCSVKSSARRWSVSTAGHLSTAACWILRRDCRASSYLASSQAMSRRPCTSPLASLSQLTTESSAGRQTTGCTSFRYGKSSQLATTIDPLAVQVQ